MKITTILKLLALSCLIWGYSAPASRISTIISCAVDFAIPHDCIGGDTERDRSQRLLYERWAREYRIDY